MGKTKNLLWTGGWDSTYRFVELSFHEIVIQPIYVFGDNRLSERYERKAMNIILNLVQNDSRTKAKILPIILIEKSSIKEDFLITEAFKRVYKVTELGSQHEWIARLAKQFPNLEIGTEKTDESISRIMKSINRYGKIELNSKGDNIFVPNQIGNDGDLLFGNLRFPIINKSGPEMRDDITLWGYSEVMENIWFCHRPYFGEMCGICHPCQLKIDTGMNHLFTNNSLNRYYNRDKFPNKLIYNLFDRLNYYYNTLMNVIFSKKIRKK